MARVLKVRIAPDEYRPFTHMIQCPACEIGHGFKVGQNGWTFNGDFEKPTFSPSLLVRGGTGPNSICHSFVREGKIEFLSDCTHDMAGKTIDLPEIL